MVDDADRFETATPVIVTAGATTTADAELAPPATISGTVTMEGGDPATGGCVGVFVDWGTPVASDCVDGSGTYTITDIPPGVDYLIGFKGFDSAADEWYADSTSNEEAARVSLAPGGSLTIDAVLGQGGYISGTVTVDGGGAVGDGNIHFFDENRRHITGIGFHLSSGQYVSPGLPAGTYYMCIGASGEAAGECYHDESALWSATPIVVVAGETTTIDETLAVGGRISGTVTLEGGGALTGGRVNLFDSAGEWVMWAEPDVDGLYSYTNLLPGTYLLSFDGFDGAVDEKYDDQPYSSSGTPIVVVSGETTTANAELAAGGYIDATVTLEGGAPATGGTVYVWNSAHEGGGYGVDESGHVLVGALPPGTYYLELGDFDGGAIGEWYDDATDFDTATPVVVTAGETTVIDAALAQSGSISGTVTNPYGDLSGAMVFLVPSWTLAALNPDGSYSFEEVSPGTYDVLYLAFPGAAQQFYENSQSLADATHVVVASGEDVTGIDAALEPEAVITGNLYVPADFTSPTVCMGAFLANGELRGIHCGDVGEPFVFGGLHAGTIYLRVVDTADSSSPSWDLLPPGERWYANADSLGSAAAITLAAGETVAINLVWDEPTVSDVSPSSGPTTGGTSVTITGGYFVDVTSVTFDGVAGTGLSVASDAELTVTAPAGSAGAADVVVTTLVWVVRSGFVHVCGTPDGLGCQRGSGPGGRRDHRGGDR